MSRTVILLASVLADSYLARIMLRFPTVLLALLVLARTADAQAPAAPYRNATLPIEARVRDLLGRMTLEEKFWQLFMIPGNLDDSTHDYSHGAFGLQISNGTGGARGHAERINAIQRFFVERSRLRIPDCCPCCG